MMMSNGLAPSLVLSVGLLSINFTQGGVRDWHNIWLSFAGCALIIAIALLFYLNSIKRMLLV
jgi:NHS family xanthosine MFS transporter